jgi:histidyl-tRNA synthetase
MADKILAVKGMNDILPGSVPRKDRLPDSALWRWFERTVDRVLSQHGYQYLMTPVVEPRPPTSSRRRCTPGPTR